MKYMQGAPNASGAYPAPQSTPFPGAIPLTDEQAQTVVDYNGYVIVTSREEPVDPEDDSITQTVYTVEPNTEAWEAWKQEKAEKPGPDPEPEPESTGAYVTYTELAQAIREGVNLVD